MKRRDLIRKIQTVGYRLVRSSGPHDVFACPGKPKVAVPRHNEIKELLARKILREAGTE